MQSRTAAQLENIIAALQGAGTLRGIKTAVRTAGPDILRENIISIDLAAQIISYAEEENQLAYVSAYLHNSFVSFSDQFRFFESVTKTSSAQEHAELAEVLLTRILRVPQLADTHDEHTQKLKHALEQTRKNLNHALVVIKAKTSDDTEAQLQTSYLTALVLIRKFAARPSIEVAISEMSKNADELVIPPSHIATETAIAKKAAEAPAIKIDEPELIPDYSSLSMEGLRKIFADLRARMQKGDSCHKELQRLYCQENIRKLIYKNDDLEYEFKELNSLSVTILANSLIAINRDKFAAVDSNDFFVNTQKEPAISITNAIKFFNKTSEFIVEDITSRKSIDETTLAIEHWLRVAEKCLDNPDLQDSGMAFCIASAVNHSAVSRLKKSFAGLSKHGQEIYARLDELKDFHGNFANLRRFHEDPQHANATPYFGIYLTQFNALRENSSYAKAYHVKSDSFAVKLNFKLRNIIKNLQQVNLPFKNYRALENKILGLNFVENTAYDRSLKLEPRDNDLTPSELGKASLYKKSSKQNETQVPHSQAASIQNPATSILILDERSAEFLPFAALFKGNVVGLITDGNIPAGASSPYSKRRADVDKLVTDFIAHNKIFFNQDEKSRLRLYCLKTRGREADIDLSMLEEASRKKILDAINAPNFVAETLEQLRPAITQDILTQQILASYNEKTSSNVNYRNAFILDRYALQLFSNERHHYVGAFEPMDEPPLRKVMATLYLVFTQHDFFSNPDNDANNVLLMNNRAELANLFFTQLSQQEFFEIYRILQTKNPNNPAQILIDLLPESMRHTVEELNYEYRIGFSTNLKIQRQQQNKRLDQVTGDLFKKAKAIMPANEYSALRIVIEDLAQYAREQQHDEFGVMRARKIIEVITTLSTYNNPKEMQAFITQKLKNDTEIKSHRRLHIPNIHLTTKVREVATTPKTTLEKKLENLSHALESFKTAEPLSSTATVAARIKAPVEPLPRTEPVPAPAPPPVAEHAAPVAAHPPKVAPPPAPIPAVEQLDLNVTLTPVLTRMENFLETMQRELRELAAMNEQLNDIRHRQMLFAHNERLKPEGDKPEAAPKLGLHHDD